MGPAVHPGVHRGGEAVPTCSRDSWFVDEIAGRHRLAARSTTSRPPSEPARHRDPVPAYVEKAQRNSALPTRTGASEQLWSNISRHRSRPIGSFLTSRVPVNIGPPSKHGASTAGKSGQTGHKRRPRADEAPGHPVCAARDLNPEPVDYPRGPEDEFGARRRALVAREPGTGGRQEITTTRDLRRQDGRPYPCIRPGRMR
jgi:hypothetical protein